MAERKKFSELASLTSITGNEIVPVGYNGDNFKATLNALKEFFGELKVQVFTELITAAVSIVQGSPSSESGATLDVVYLAHHRCFAMRKRVGSGSPSYYASWSGVANYMSGSSVRTDSAFVCLTDTLVYVYDGTTLITRTPSDGGSVLEPRVAQLEGTVQALSVADKQLHYAIDELEGADATTNQRINELTDELSQEESDRNTQMSAINSNISSINANMASLNSQVPQLRQYLDSEVARAQRAEEVIAAEVESTNERIDQTQQDVKALQLSDDQSVKSLQVRSIIVLTQAEYDALETRDEHTVYYITEE